MCDNLTLLTHAIDIEGDSGRPLTVHTTAVLQLPNPDGHTPMELAAHYDHQSAIRLLQAHIDQSTGRGQPRCRPDRVTAERAYSSRGFRAHLRRRGIVHTIPGSGRATGGAPWLLAAAGSAVSV